MDITLTRTLTGVGPGDDFAKDYLRKWPIGESRRANVRRPRALKALRRWWVLCNLIYQNSEQFTSPELVHQYLKIKAGHTIPIVSKSTGEVFLLPDSISFDSIDESGFQNVWARAIKVVSEDILGTGVAEIEAEIQRLLGFSR